MQFLQTKKTVFWFLRLGAPVFAKPIARLFKKSVSFFIQKRAYISCLLYKKHVHQ